MLTPQDLQEVSFEKAKIGGYLMKSVDEFLEPLLEDYVTLYKENAVLKSKMRLLVDRLEYYRTNETKLKEAVEDAKQGRSVSTDYDKALALGLGKDEDGQRLLQQTDDASSDLAAEQKRLYLAKQATAEFVSAVEAQIARQQEALEAIKALQLPKQKTEEKNARVYRPDERSDDNSPETIAAQIEQNVSRITGDSPRIKVDKVDRTATTRVLPVLDERTTAKLENLQLGRNYRPE